MLQNGVGRSEKRKLGLFPPVSSQCGLHLIPSLLIYTAKLTSIGVNDFAKGLWNAADVGCYRIRDICPTTGGPLLRLPCLKRIHNRLLPGRISAHFRCHWPQLSKRGAQLRNGDPITMNPIDHSLHLDSLNYTKADGSQQELALSANELWVPSF